MRAFVHGKKAILVAGFAVVVAGATVRGEGAAAPAGAGPSTLMADPAMAAPRAAAELRIGGGPRAAEAATEGNSAVSARVNEAYAALSSKVGRTSDSRALRSALQAYFAFRAENPEQVRRPYLYFVDYGLSNRTPRGWVFNMETLAVVDGPFTVAHGRGSGPRNGVPTRFSNVSGSATSSLGLYIAQETYDFGGKAGGRYYRSIGLRMKGVSGEFNSRARARGVVAHGAPYVSARDAGRSEGCPAMEEFRAQRLLPMLAGGGMVFIFSPADREWLRSDPWVTTD